MQTKLLDMAGEIAQPIIDATDLSFKKFILHLENMRATEKTARGKFYQFVLDKFAERPELTEKVTLQAIGNYEEWLELVYASLLPVISNEENSFWGLSIPLVPKIFYSTNALYNLMTEEDTGRTRSEIINLNDAALQEKRDEMMYTFLLENLYNLTSLSKHELAHSFVDPATGLTKFYRINIDTRFIDVEVTGGLPRVSMETLDTYVQEGKAVVYLKELLPLSLFRFHGFSVITLTDITEQSAVENIKESIINRVAHNDELYYERVTNSLKTLCGNSAIEFGLMPMLRINGKLVFNAETCLHSILIEKARLYGIAETAYLTTAEKYAKSPKLYFFKRLPMKMLNSRFF